MIEVPVQDLSKGVSATRLTDVIRNKRVLLTLEGKPFAYIMNVEHFGDNYDAEDFDYMTDPEFWAMIRERRKERGGIPLEQIEEELGIKPRGRGRKRKNVLASKGR